MGTSAEKVWQELPVEILKNARPVESFETGKRRPPRKTIRGAKFAPQKAAAAKAVGLAEYTQGGASGDAG